MPHIRSHAFGPSPCISLCFSLCITAALLVFDASAASAGKIKMVFPGPVTTFSLPYLVAQKKGWLGDLEVEDVHVTGDANAMRVLLSGNADIGLIGTLNVLASINAGASIRAVHSWQPIGDYSLVLATGKGSKLADVAGKTFASSGPGGLPDQLPRLIMRKHGIDETTARFVQVGGHAARLQAVICGRADATLVNTVTALKGLDPAIEEFTADLNMKLGNLPVAAPAKDVLEPRFVDRALEKLGSYQTK